MFKSRTRAEMFLETFFDNELYFFADKSKQQDAWFFGGGEHPFVIPFMLFFEGWAMIVENRNKYEHLSNSDFNKIQKLYDMLNAFQASIMFPTTPKEYLELLCNSELKKIREYALLLYKTIRPE